MQANLNTEITRATVAENTESSTRASADVALNIAVTSLTASVRCVGINNCAGLKSAGCLGSAGLYSVSPTGFGSMQVWCDTDGWTLVVSESAVFIMREFGLYF